METHLLPSGTYLEQKKGYIERSNMKQRETCLHRETNL